MKQYIIGSMLLSSILLASCSLDETPRSKFSEEEAFSTPKLVYVNTVANVYSSIGNGIVWKRWWLGTHLPGVLF